MNRRSTLVAAMFIALLCAVTLPGCSDPKAAAMGSYDVDKAAIKAAAEAEIKSKGENSQESMGAAMMLAMIDDMAMTLTLNADGTASMMQSAMGQSNTSSGTWTISGKTITIMAAPPGQTPEAITGTLSGDTITIKPPKGEQMPFDLVFKKRKA